MNNEKSLQKSILSVVNAMKTRVIDNDSEFSFACEWLKQNKTTQKIVKDAFDSDLQVAKNQVSDIKAKIDSFLSPLTESEKTVKNQILAYEQKLENLRLEAEEKLALAQESGKTDRTIQKYEKELETVSAPAPRSKGISYREDWTFDIDDSSIIPREYMIPDSVAIGKYARALKDKASIPGIKFYSVKTVASRKG